MLSAAGISVSLMQTLIIPLIPELPKLLNANWSDASWAITITLLTGAVATPVFGRLGDMYGPKPILVVCALLLTVGSLTAAATSTLLPFVVGRGLQGFGMPIIPLGISVLRSCVPPEKVGAAMGLMSASLGVGGALGLPLSAVIAEQFDWHVLFWFSAGLGVASLLLFLFLVPRVAAVSSDRLDVLGVVGLAGGLVTLLLGITKGQSWGWTSTTTIGMFATSCVVFALFAMWQLRVSAPIVDLRTTVRRPVLTTNLASVGIGFAMFAMSLIAPQILELPPQTGYGLGQSMLSTGLWLAPGGLAMMLSAPIAARVAGRHGPRFTFVVGCAIVCLSYLGGQRLIESAPGILAFNVVVSVGVGFAFASMPSLINAAVPMSETAAANGINSLARSLGTSISSAVLAAILAGMTMSVAGQDLPTLTAFRVALFIAAGAAAIATGFAWLIPKAEPVPVPAASLPRLRGGQWLERSTYLVCDHIDAVGALSFDELATEFQIDVPTAGRHVTELLREGLALGADDGDSLSFSLTPRGRDRLYQHRAAVGV